ncbi:atypical kinase COQ8B, mitochondrial-like [Ammospiza maritima maritima]
MPGWQSRAVLDAELGRGWREQLQEFQEVPVAAASLGQVHWGRLRCGTPVAIKVQAQTDGFGLQFWELKLEYGLEAPALSEGSAERLVAALSRARGAALKVGQLLSMADAELLPPQLQPLLARLRQSAEPMPGWQSRAVLDAELGRGWREQLQEFQEVPVAAASLGQVHRGRLRCGTPVAIKVQYPGVARSIGSDVENLLTLLSLTPGLPKGLFAAPALRALQRELELECDYEREAQSTQKFRSLLGSDRFFRVPAVVPALSARRVLCTEWGRGAALERCRGLPQERRDQICTELLRLCLQELFQFRFMQTDPNWANFLYDPERHKVTLLDFGACRSFEKEFTDLYIEVIRAAADRDEEKILSKSRELKFLTGFESPAMESLHVQAVLLLGEPFWGSQPFDFGAQGTARGVRGLLPRMLRGRLGPPPEPSYALHRKLGGVFMACAHLGGRVRCRELFLQLHSSYTQRGNASSAEGGLQPKNGVTSSGIPECRKGP